MASALVPVTVAMEFLGVEDAQEIPVLERIIDGVEALFLVQANRRERPFQAAQAGRVDVLDGTGSPVLVLDYPVTSLTSVLIGADPLAPVESLAVADVQVLRYRVNRATLTRIGGTFGTRADPRVVHVTYNAAADLPEEVRLAVLSVTAAVYRRRGSEDASSERVGGYATDLAAVAKSDPLWQMALSAHWAPVFP